MKKNSYSHFQGILLMILCLGTQVSLAAQSALQRAQLSYQKRDYNQSLEEYEKLVAAGYHQADLYYNVGNVAFRAGELGKAILYYEKALALKPNNEATLSNLERVRSELTDQIDHSTVPNWWEWLIRPQWIMRPNSWAILFAVLIWLGTGLWFWLRQLSSQKRWVYWVTVGVFALASVALTGAALSYWNTYHNPIGVILSKEITLRIGPEKASPAIRTLHEGTKVAYLDKIGSWDKVRLSNGQEGWLEEKSTKNIH